MQQTRKNQGSFGKGLKEFTMEKTTRALVIVAVLFGVIYLHFINNLNKASDKKTPAFFSSVDSVRTKEYETEVFKYSQDTLYDTVLGIKDRNCRTLHDHQTVTENDSFCDRLQKCNKASASDLDLPDGCQRRFPGCIIIGVFKAGTRELIDFLAMHPRIVVKREPIYEISFFSKRWHKGLDWYRKNMPFSMKSQITIEKSPDYFYFPSVPERIKTMDPGVKMILIVRDPVERAVSQMSFRYPEKFIGNFEAFFQRLYNRSVYDEQFERYLKHFDRSQIHIIDSIKFRDSPYTVLSEVETFLGLPHVFGRNEFVFNEEKGFYCIRNVDRIYSSCYGDNRGKKKYGEEVEVLKRRLLPLLKKHNERFFNLTGQRFQWQ